MEYRFKPQGVCSREMIIELDGDIIKKVEIIGGCAGNSAGVAKLVVGRKVEEVIELLKGTPCGYKGTSCPDQLALGLEKALKEMKKAK